MEKRPSVMSEYFGRFWMDLTCPSCGREFPVEGPTRSVSCPGCGRTQPVGEHLAETVLGFERNEGDCRAGRVVTTIGGLNARTRCRAVEAACLRCGVVMPWGALGRSGRYRCVSCGMEHEVQAVPEWIRSVAGEARVCVTPVCEDGGDGRTELGRSADDGKVELLSCPGCKGNLKITAATARDTACEYCGMAIRLADDLWSRLHPWVDSSWLVGFEGEKDVIEKERSGRVRRQIEERAEQDSAARRNRLVLSVWTGIGVAFVMWLAANAAVPWRIGLVVGLAVGLVTGVVTYLIEGRRKARESDEEIARLVKHRSLERTGKRMTGTVDGRRLLVDLDAGYLVEVALSGCPWYLSTREEKPDLPGFEPFSTGQTGFDAFFRTRLARSDVARGLPASGAHAAIADFLKYGFRGISDVLIAPDRVALNPIVGLGSEVGSGRRAFDFHGTEHLILSAKDLAPKLEAASEAAPAPPVAPAAPGVLRPIAWDSQDERRALLDFGAEVDDPLGTRDLPVFGRIEIALACDRCGNGIPVNGPFDALACPACGRRCDPSMLVVVLAYGFASGANRRAGQNVMTMAGLQTFHPKKGESGRLGPTKVMGKAARFKASYRREEPHCGKCGAPLGDAAEGPSGPVVCPKCGAAHRLIEPPVWLVKEVPSASACLTLDEDLPPPADQVEAKPLACPGCGAGVVLGPDRPRSGDCPYCHGHLVIPDDVWQWLHPGGSHAWHIRFDPSAPGFV